MRILVFNPEHDIALASNLDHFTPPHAARNLRRDLSFLPALWAGENDYVLVDDVDAAWNGFRKTGIIKNCNFIVTSELNTISSSNSLIVFEPWGWDSAIRKNLIQAGVQSSLLPDDTHLNMIRQTSHRAWAAEHLLRPLRQMVNSVGLSETAHSMAEVRRFLAVHHQMVLKAPWSCSGRGIRYVSDGFDNGFVSSFGLTKQMEGWVNNVLAQQGCIMMEPYYNKVSDFGMEFFSDGHGHVRYCGLSVFKTINGFYAGNMIEDEPAKEQELRKYISLSVLEAVRQDIIKLLSVELGQKYEGPFGIDMMLVNKDGTIVLHPCVELNLRMTMGHVALHLSQVEQKQRKLMRMIYSGGKYKLELY